MPWVIFNAVALSCVLLFGGIGLWAYNRKTPMHFWAGSTVPPETITDVKEYNRMHALMWFCYCIPFVISMVVSVFSVLVAGLVLMVWCVFGTVLLVAAYVFIKKKYTKSCSSSNEESRR